MRWHVMLAGVCALALAGSADAQYLFLDTNGDGRWTSEDRMRLDGDTRVAIWLDTNHNRDGSAARPSGSAKQLFTINAYQIILRAVGGTVMWGRYVNLMPTMTSGLAKFASATEFSTGWGGVDLLPPGTYKLGVLEVQAKSGAPSIGIVSGSAARGDLLTGFGSQRPGRDYDNTLKFSERLGDGDWTDVDGIGASSKAEGGVSPHEFAVRLSPNPFNPVGSFVVATVTPGPLSIQIFGPDGRLVRSLLEERRASPGERTVIFDGKGQGGASLASGVYLYRVRSPDGTKTGKLSVVR
jgi:hypothetical protein